MLQWRGGWGLNARAARIPRPKGESGGCTQAHAKRILSVLTFARVSR